MREIKYRAFLKSNKLMYDVDTIHIIEGKINLIDNNDLLLCEINDVILMQYTGLNDKNGKEICESDIVSRGKYNFEVVWNERKGWYGIDDFDNGLTVLSQHLDYVEVIGNIYENLELLK